MLMEMRIGCIKAKGPLETLNKGIYDSWQVNVDPFKCMFLFSIWLFASANGFEMALKAEVLVWKLKQLQKIYKKL